MATTAIDRGDPLVSPAPKGLLGPDGQPVGHRDPFFTSINSELADKGFLVTATDDLTAGWAPAEALATRLCNALGRNFTLP